MQFQMEFLSTLQSTQSQLSTSEFKLLDRVSIITDDKLTHIVLIIKEMLTLNVGM